MSNSKTVSITSRGYRADIAKQKNVIGTRIAEARKIAGLRQAELSGKMRDLGADVSAQSISKWEKGDPKRLPADRPWLRPEDPEYFRIFQRCCSIYCPGSERGRTQASDGV